MWAPELRRMPFGRRWVVLDREMNVTYHNSIGDAPYMFHDHKEAKATADHLNHQRQLTREALSS